MAELTVLDQLNLGVLDLDEQGRVSFANQTARRWLGDEVLRATFSELLIAGSRLFYLNHLYPLLNQGQELEEAYLSLRDEQNRELPVLLNGTSLKSGQKRLSFIPIRRRAIIEQQLLKAKEEAEAAVRSQKTTLEELKQAQARLALQDRLVVMGTLAAGVAHEINNPLTYIIGNLDFLAAARLEEEERQSLSDVQEGVQRIQGIVNSLKVLSRSEEDRKVPLDLNQMGQVACRLASKECSICCQLHTDWHGEPLLVLGDEGKLTQVLLNLLLNACQAFTQPDFHNNWIQVRSWKDGGEACLDIRDNGPGIPPELTNRIFDAFFTTKPVGAGTGLGLSICQGIVKSLEGRLELMPSESGACFRITLPLHSSSFTAERTLERKSNGLEGLHCLIIDDDEQVARALKRVLSHCHCQIAAGGQKGLETLRGQTGFDLILCDLRMPDLSGFEVYQAAPEHQRPRFIFVTGGVSAEEELLIEKTGAPLLNKPFGPEKVAAAYLLLNRRI